MRSRNRTFVHLVTAENTTDLKGLSTYTCVSNTMPEVRLKERRLPNKWYGLLEVVRTIILYTNT